MIRPFMLFLLFISSSLMAQDLSIVSATSQNVRKKSAEAASVNYKILIKKQDAFKWSVDSVVDVYTQRRVDFTFSKQTASGNPVNPVKKRYCFRKKDKGTFEIGFSAVLPPEAGQPKTPMNQRVPVDGFTQGVIIFYTSGKQKKQLRIESFDALSDLNTPD